MRSIKKIAALVLSLAMLATMFAFSASAETAANLYLEGPDNATKGEVYTVSIRLSDEANRVGGFSGTLTYSGATFVKTEVHPSVLALNDTTDASTVITNEGTDTIKFVTVTRVDGSNTTNPTNAIWFKVQFKITGEASFTLGDVKFSNKAGQALLSETEGTFGAALKPTVEANNTIYAINKIGMKDTADAKKQGLEYEVAFPGEKIPDGATEYGVVFYPTSLLNGADLTIETDGAVVAKVTKDDANFEAFVTNGTYYAYLSFNFSDNAKAHRFLGTKISAIAYYKVGDEIVYSTNTNNIGVEDGVADKAVLNVALEKAAEKVDLQTQDVKDAIADLDGENYIANRGTLLQFVADNF